MNFSLARPPILLAGVTILLAGAISTRGAGVQSGVNSVPANTSWQLNSCGACHSSSSPAPGRTSAPTVTLSAAQLALRPGQSTAVTVGASGGISGTTGGFLCEATAGTFTAGANSRVNSGNTSITHSSNAARSWTFTYTAPNTVGPVDITGVAMTSSGSSSGGDRFSFSGYDNNATIGTPIRLFVLPAGVEALGRSCPDGFGNYSVLGATSAPTVGNAAFGFRMIGVTPGSAALIYYTINPPGFTSVDLGPALGLHGCTAWIANVMQENMALTGSGVATRAEGSCTFALPLINDPQLRGLTFQAQGVYFDPSATMRSMTVSVTNGLRVTVQ